MIVICDKLSTAEVLDQELNLYKLGPDVGQMKVFVMRVGLIGKRPSSYNLFEYSLSITQNLYVFFPFPSTRVDRLSGDTCPYVCPQTGLN